MFCIRRTSDGLYSTGGATPRFVEIDDGREWAQKGHLKRHLRLATYDQGTCEIIEFDDRTRSEVSNLPLDGYYEPAVAIAHYAVSSASAVPVCGTSVWSSTTRSKKKVGCQNCRKTIAFQGKR
jgi:hypothetical protein